MLRATPKSTDLHRRQLVRGDPCGNRIPRRPPWARTETRFIELCTRCDDCIRACEADILHRGSGGFPEVRFEESGCDFCGDCLEACRSGALDAPHPAPSLAWQWKAEITDSCFSIRGIVCRACGDACDTDAIRFELRPGGKAIPTVDPASCNGCGECLVVCPENSVSLRIPKSTLINEEYR